jgi:sialate O-acetylesterase
MKNKIITITRLAVFIGASALAAARADVTPATIFQDHAVLQAGKPLPVWGKADAGEKVKVSFAGQTVSTKAGVDGAWKVILRPLKISGEPGVLRITGKNKIVLQDILVGEVWLCSGQSNMDFRLNHVTNALAEIAGANFPFIRQFQVRNNVANTPQAAVKGNWMVCQPTTAGDFTAVGYFFARELHQKLGVPVGLLHSSWGGTDIEAWMSAESIAADTNLIFVAEHWQKKIDNYPAAKAAWNAKEAAAVKAETEAKTNGVAYKKPWNPLPPNPDGSPYYNKPSNLFNGMIAPLVPAAIAGVVWYQGENNVGRAHEYSQLFPMLITGWREVFGQPNLPFYWVQLPNFHGYEKAHDWVDLRAAQSSALALPCTAQAITIDVGEVDNIHPLDKQDVGHRLAIIALQKTYGQKIVSSGPVFSSVNFTNGAAEVAFTEIAGGLETKGSMLTGFELAGADRIFHPAEAKIAGATMVVSCAAVTVPVAVRYAWHNAPDASLANTEGLPAVPFRSDDW